jgi:hypothetical protein
MFQRDGAADVAIFEGPQTAVEYVLKRLSFEDAGWFREQDAEAGQPMGTTLETLRDLGALRDKTRFIEAVEDFTLEWSEPAYVILQRERVR